jgi:hypothetical protein
MAICLAVYELLYQLERKNGILQALVANTLKMDASFLLRLTSSKNFVDTQDL